MDLILCSHLWGAWTRIDWNEFNSLSELERSLNLEQEAERVKKREREIFLVVDDDDDGNEVNVKQKCETEASHKQSTASCRKPRPAVCCSETILCIHI